MSSKYGKGDLVNTMEGGMERERQATIWGQQEQATPWPVQTPGKVILFRDSASICHYE